MGIPDILKFASREFPNSVTKLPNPEDKRAVRSRFDFVLVDMSNVIQTVGIDAVATLLKHQVEVTCAIILVGDGNRQRSGTQHRKHRIVKSDKDVDSAMMDLSLTLTQHFETKQRQQQGAGRRNDSGNKNSTSSQQKAGDRRSRDESGEAEPAGGSKKVTPTTTTTAAAQPPQPPQAPVIVTVGSDIFGEGDFKMLHLHRHLALHYAATAAKDSNSSHDQAKSPSSPFSLCDPTGRLGAAIGAAPHSSSSSSFLFVSEDSDLFCGALCGPDPHDVYLATSFHDMVSSFCLVSIGRCAESLCFAAGVDMGAIHSPAQQFRCLHNVALDVVTLFTILLGNGQCPALAKGATRVDSRAVWNAYCEVRWPSDERTQLMYPNGHFLVDAHSMNLMGARYSQTASAGPANALVIDCELLARVLQHVHCTADPLVQNAAPAAEARKLARDYLGAIARSAFRYTSGTTVDTREEMQPPAPSLASLCYVAEDAALRFYPLTCSLRVPTAFAMNLSGIVPGSSSCSSSAAVRSSSSSSSSSATAAATATPFVPVTLSMGAPRILASTAAKVNSSSTTSGNELSYAELMTAFATTLNRHEDMVPQNINIADGGSSGGEEAGGGGGSNKGFRQVMQQQQQQQQQKTSSQQRSTFSFELRRLVEQRPVTATDNNNDNATIGAVVGEEHESSGSKGKKKHHKGPKVADEFSYFDDIVNTPLPQRNARDQNKKAKKHQQQPGHQVQQINDNNGNNNNNNNNNGGGKSSISAVAALHAGKKISKSTDDSNNIVDGEPKKKRKRLQKKERLKRRQQASEQKTGTTSE